MINRTVAVCVGSMQPRRSAEAGVAGLAPGSWDHVAVRFPPPPSGSPRDRFLLGIRHVRVRSGLGGLAVAASTLALPAPAAAHGVVPADPPSAINLALGW